MDVNNTTPPAPEDEVPQTYILSLAN